MIKKIHQYLSQITLAQLFPLVILFIFLCVGMATYEIAATHYYFVYQADGFLHGSVFYHTLPSTPLDSSEGLGGQYYWPLGPFPAVLLMPFVALFGIVPMQGVFQLLLTILAFYLCVRLARHFGYSSANSLWLALAFVFGSVYMGIALLPYAWQFATAISTVLVLATLDEHFNRRRYWLMGLYLACAFATRFTAGLAVIYVIIDTLVTTTVPIKLRFKQLVKLLTPIILVGISLLWLNYARTGSMLDNGYRTSIMDESYQSRAREQYGLFSLKNIPTNLYYYFMIPPQPVYQEEGMFHIIPPYFKTDIGIGFFYLSPIFLLIVRSVWKKKEQLLAGITAGIILFVLLTYYAINAFMLGTYYLADILSFLFILLILSSYQANLGLFAKIVIFFSCIINLYFFTAIPWHGIF